MHPGPGREACRCRDPRPSEGQRASLAPGRKGPRAQAHSRDRCEGAEREVRAQGSSRQSGAGGRAGLWSGRLPVQRTQARASLVGERGRRAARGACAHRGAGGAQTPTPAGRPARLPVGTGGRKEDRRGLRASPRPTLAWRPNHVPCSQGPRPHLAESQCGGLQAATYRGALTLGDWRQVDFQPWGRRTRQVQSR